MAKALSLNEIRRRAAQFVVDWRDEPGDERQQAQSFIRDLLRVFGITSTKAALYEKRAKRSSTGHRGYIDALVPGLCAIEMKSAGKDLEVAERQALDYIDDLTDVETPRWVISSNFTQFRVLDLQAPDGADTHTFTLEELPANSDLLAFLAGYQTSSFGSQQQEEASVKAAQIMADLYEALSESGYDDHDASVFLVRVLFCLYADDAGVWGERDQFYEFLEQRTSEDGSDLGPQLAMLFQAMNRDTAKRQRNLDESIARFPYVNGGIFAEPASIPSFDSGMRELLLQACAFNWSAISPAIFGSLFQAVKDSQARRELGEHYTTETNILKTIQPLFLDELRGRFTDAVHDTGKLKRLRADLGQLRILDPACGCGNFLVVAYRELRALDLDILKRLHELGDTSWQSPTAFFLKEDLPVTLDHFAGIEIEEWPARIASTALHLVDHQANQAMELALGKAPDPLPLDRIETIHVHNALRADWSRIFPASPRVMIVGNPPFIGHTTKTRDQVEDLKAVWGEDYDGYLDYVTAWYKKAADYFHYTRGGRFAFVSTNSIAQGLPVAALFKPILEAGWRIRFAHQTFAWTSEAPGLAHVHCVIVGFDKHEKTPAALYSYDTPKGQPEQKPARSINPYLVDGPSAYIAKRSKPLSPELPPVQYGSMPNDGGHLLVGPEGYPELSLDPAASKYLRRFVGARELIRGTPRWCLWLENLDPTDLKPTGLLRGRIEAVRSYREASRRAATSKLAATPSLFGERRQPRVPYVCIPRHFSETRRFATVAHFGPEVIAGDANFTAEDPTGYLFAIISSSMFMAWQRATGGRIKSDLRFSATVVWNNLPLPEVSDTVRAKIIAAGAAVLDARALHPGRSLADHYNPLAMDPTLLKAHDALDRVVDKAFGARKTLRTEEERQEVLFKRYTELTGA
ncbi:MULTISPECIES: class I SAM-dependent DNA methyltransferase [Brachybacterium]|uniref:site-specific DNA-methyltransferase (adenine-specific) n=2 Tax=Brachybacterium TaxID=43668 RepID=A0A3R8SMM5_9MICO|nr:MULTISPECIES: DNA methyltransferase [Brachybacterium]RRR16935.1 class I SAM-dependent DNA methyltransferase [Brachybacterium paraconglomeratum]GLI32534.1 methylase [Brachybacterium conglomeratum]GLK06584.1 methylase [Brachybacterium conglomeratum]